MMTSVRAKDDFGRLQYDFEQTFLYDGICTLSTLSEVYVWNGYLSRVSGNNGQRRQVDAGSAIIWCMTNVLLYADVRYHVRFVEGVISRLHFCPQSPV